MCIRDSARDMAISRASIENIPVLLSTSIPSLETFNNVKNKKYNYTKLEKRYKNFSLPNAEVVDLKLDRKKKNIWLDPKTINFVKKYLEKKNYLEIAEISFWSLEIVLEALLRCIIFFLVDLCKTDITILNFSIDSSTFLSLMSLSIAFNWVETLDFTALFTVFFLSD